jgi:hypothetical protein
MKQFRRRKNFLRALVLGFATAAIVASGAQARVGNYNQSAQQARDAYNQTYTPEALKALTLRSEAMNQQYQSVGGTEIRTESLNKLSQAEAVRPDDRAGVRGVTPEPVQAATDLSEIQRQVEADRIASLIAADSKRPDDKAGIHGPGVVQTPEPVSASGSSFDWKDAGIGAGTAVGVALVLMSAFLISKRRQSGLAV